MIKQKIVFLIWAIFCFVSSDISQVSGLNQYIDSRYSDNTLAYVAIIHVVIMGWVTYVLYPREERFT